MGNSEYLLAAQAFSKVAENFPEDSLADDAMFESARAYQRLWRSPELDSQYGTTAQATFRTLVAVYPDSPQRKDAERGAGGARRNVRRARNISSGYYYFRRKAYDPAIFYFKTVVTTYPEAAEVSRRLSAHDRVVPRDPVRGRGGGGLHGGPRSLRGRPGGEAPLSAGVSAARQRAGPGTAIRRRRFRPPEALSRCADRPVWRQLRPAAYRALACRGRRVRAAGARPARLHPGAAAAAEGGGHAATASSGSRCSTAMVAGDAAFRRQSGRNWARGIILHG